METEFLSLEELCRRHPNAVKAFRPLASAHPMIFVATADRIVLGDIDSHLVLALSAWPPFPVDPTSLLLQAASVDQRHEVVGHVRPKVRAAGFVDRNGIIRSYDCPSLNVFFDDQARGYENELYVNELRAAVYDAVRTPRRSRRLA